MAVIISDQIPGPAGAFVPSVSWSPAQSTAPWTAAGTTPAVVDAGDGQFGWSFGTASASLASCAVAATTSRRVLDVIVNIGGVPTSNQEMLSARTSAAKFSSVNITSSGRYALANASAAVATGTKAVITGAKHRITYDLNGATATVTIYADDTGVTVYETLTGAITASSLASLRIGWGGAAGQALIASWPMLADAPADVGPRTYASATGIPSGWHEYRIFGR